MLNTTQLHNLYKMYLNKTDFKYIITCDHTLPVRSGAQNYIRHTRFKDSWSSMIVRK